jgi:hypothetical protein
VELRWYPAGRADPLLEQADVRDFAERLAEYPLDPNKPSPESVGGALHSDAPAKHVFGVDA